MPRISDPNDKYYIDNPGRVKAIQSEMARRGIDVYLGSRIRTMSFVMDTFCPWRSYLIIPPEGKPTYFTFVVDALPGFEWINSHDIIDALSLIKDKGTIERFRTASLIVDEGHKACEHGIGLFGDEWRIGAVVNPDLPYWTDQDHVYQENEMVVCAMQYAAPEENIGFRYENDIVITKDGCEVLSKYPLGIEEIS
jgi:Xaa-Pro aminopeptidase